MTYRLHIERDPSISLDEWRATIRGQASVKEDERPVTSVNPVTGVRISIPGRPGDVAILVDGEWIKTFSWNRDRASFNAPRNLSAVDPTMAAAMQLAVALSAVIRGDEGEVYPA